VDILLFIVVEFINLSLLSYKFKTIGYETEENSPFQDKFQILKIIFSLAIEELAIEVATESSIETLSTIKVFIHSLAVIDELKV
jgi:hypothetical protein